MSANLDPTCQHCKELPGETRPEREGAVLCDRCCRALDLVNKAVIEQLAAMRFGTPERKDAA